MREKSSFFARLTGAGKNEDLPEEIEENSKVLNNDSAWFDEDEEGQLTVDVYQNSDEIVIKSMVAGVKPEDLDISITRDMVTIKGKRETERNIDEGDYFHRELYWGSFSRTIMLPSEIDVEEAEAIEKHGLLILKLPKIDKNKQTRLKVKG